MNVSNRYNIKSAAEELTKSNLEAYQWTFSLFGFKKSVVRLIEALRSAMYPCIFGQRACSRANVKNAVCAYLKNSAAILEKLLDKVLPEKSAAQKEYIIKDFIGSLPRIAEVLEKDIKAAYEGDPAALSVKEITLYYPAFEAISIYRLAHRLHKLSLPLIPRIMTEYAHSLTGIDIHPGAEIGGSFFIDHGTGVVIGETCVIGNNVKIYQGVTLGAKSFELDEKGNPVKNIKRHPEIRDNVVIYSNATILGGDTVVGEGCVIGGNTWLTHSVPGGQKVFYRG